MKQMKIKRQTILFIIILILLCIVLTNPTLENDTYYLIKIGQDILSGKMDFQDHYAWSANLSYKYPHFFYNIIIAIIYNSLGFIGVHISNIFFFICLMLSLFYIANKKIKNKNIIYIILPLIAILISDFITARSQIITYILLVWQVYNIESLLETGKRRHIVYLVISSWIIANTHAIVWPIVFVFYLPFIAEFILSSLIPNKQKNKSIILNKIKIFKTIYFKKLLFALIISFCIGLLSPGQLCYTSFIKIALGDTQSFIAEHQPLAPIQESPLYLIAIASIICILIFTKQKISISNFFIFSGLIVLSLYANRNTALFYIIGLPIFMENLDSLIKSSYILPKKFHIFLKLSYASMIAIFLLHGILTNIRRPFNDPFLSCSEVVDFLKEQENISTIKLFNPYDLGSYLLFEDIPIFIDSRAEIYTPEFGAEKNVFNDYKKITTFNNIEQIIEDYGITHFLFYKNSFLSQYFQIKNGYQTIYSDDKYVIIQKD